MTDATFGPTLRRLREDRTLSQSKLAERAGFDHSIISRWEAGTRDPTRDAVMRLAAALALSDVERDALLESAGFLGRQTVTPAALHEARTLLANAMQLLGGTV